MTLHCPLPPGSRARPVGLQPRSRSLRESPPWCGSGRSPPRCSRIRCCPLARLRVPSGPGRPAPRGRARTGAGAAHRRPMRSAASGASLCRPPGTASWDISPGIGSSSPGPRPCSPSGGRAGSGPSASAALPSPAEGEEGRLLWGRWQGTPAWWTGCPPPEDRGGSSEQEGRGFCCPEVNFLVGERGLEISPTPKARWKPCAFSLSSLFPGEQRTGHNNNNHNNRSHHS